MGRGEDNSLYERHWALTVDGDPVNLPEYTINISNAGSKTHTVLLMDWDPSKRNQIKAPHVNEDPT